MKDTLPEFNDTTQLNCDSIRLYVYPDSEALSVRKYYSYTSGEEGYPSIVDNVMDLIEEYDEIPNKEFSLSFIDYVFCSQSVLKNQTFEYTSEIKNIIIITEGNTIIRYEYLRGQLVDKKIEIPIP